MCNDRWTLICLFIAAFALSGCGGGRDDLGTVSGTVMLDGVPLANAMVEFAPQNSVGSVAYGRTDEQGRYEMMFSLNQEGASLGENRVRITTADVTMEDGQEVMRPEMVPARYNTKSELKETVEPGSNTIDFSLVTDGKVVQPEILDQ